MYPAQQYKMNQTNQTNETPEGFEGITQPSAPPEILSPEILYSTKPIIPPQPYYNLPIIQNVSQGPQRNNMDKYAKNKQAYYAKRNVYVERERERNKKNFWKGCTAFLCCCWCCCLPGGC
jgi:hypothetical protein